MMRFRSAADRLATYSVEPTRSTSSAPQKANRTALISRGEPPSRVAVSSRAATPEPLSPVVSPGAGTVDVGAPAPQPASSAATAATSAIRPFRGLAMTAQVVEKVGHDVQVTAALDPVIDVLAHGQVEHAEPERGHHHPVGRRREPPGQHVVHNAGKEVPAASALLDEVR